MTNLSDGPPGDGGTAQKPTLTQDDASDATPPRGRKGSSNDATLIEKTIRFRFRATATKNDISPASIHLHWIQIVQEALGQNIQIVSNKSRILPKVDTLTWSIEDHGKVFSTHPVVSHARSQPTSGISTETTTPVQNRKNTVIIVHRIRTSNSLQEIKNIPKVRELLQTHEVYLTEQKWSEDIWNTTHLGFIMGIDPQFLDEVNAKTRISNDIKKALPKAKIPRFELMFTTPSIETNDKYARTKAFAIETERTTSMEMMKILQIAYKDTNAFIPFHMKKKHPEAYRRTILQQTKYMAENHVIVLCNIGPDVMYYVKDHLMAINGVKDIAPAPSVEKDGKYRVQVHKSDFYKVRKILIDKLETVYQDEVPPDGKETTNRYQGKPSVAPIFSDERSSSEGSYMSASIATAMSYDAATLEEQYARYQGDKDESSTTSQATPTSWANILRQKPQRPVHIEIVDKSNDSENKKQETTELITALEASRAEVESLKSRLLQIEIEKEDEKMKMKEQVKAQVESALNEHLQHNLVQPGITTTQFSEFVAMQDRRFQDMFSMFHQLLTQSS